MSNLCEALDDIAGFFDRGRHRRSPAVKQPEVVSPCFECESCIDGVCRSSKVKRTGCERLDTFIAETQSAR